MSEWFTAALDGARREQMMVLEVRLERLRDNEAFERGAGHSSLAELWAKEARSIERVMSR